MNKRQTGGGLVHKDDGWVGHELDGDGEALALLHGQALYIAVSFFLCPTTIFTTFQIDKK